MPTVTTSPDQLVGRTEELATAIRLLDRTDPATRQATPGVLAVVGDPGIGKTRLLAEMGTTAVDRGHLVISGSASEFERYLPFGALIESLDGWLRSTQATAGSQHRVATLLGLLESTGPTHQTDGDWIGLYRETRTVLEELAAPKGLVLVLDDVHWADAATVGLVGYLLLRAPRGRFVLAMGYRRRQVDHRVEAAVHCAPSGLVERLELGPLSATESRELLGPGRSRACCAALFQESGGNPLFLKALDAAGLPPAGWSAPEDDDLPPAVHAALFSELRGLSGPAMTLAHAAAVAGDPFGYRLVAALAEIDESEAERLVDRLIKQDLLQQVGSAPRFRFRHPLLRRIVYTAIPAGWRRRAHLRAAITLERQGAPLIVRAHHVARSASPGDMAASALLADAAQSTLWQAPATAAWLLEESLRLLPTTAGTAAQRRMLTTTLARALALAGRLPAARDVGHRLLAELPLQHTAERTEVATVTAMIDRLLGRHQEAGAMLRAELSRLDPHTDTTTAVSACALQLELVTGRLLAGDFTRDRQEIVDAVDAAGRCGDRALQATAAAVLAFTRYATGRFDEALAALGDARRQIDALSDGELTRRIDAAVWLAWAELFLERYEPAIEHFDRALRLVRTTGQGHLLTYILVGIASAQLHLGRLAAARECAADAVAAAELSASDELRTMAFTLQCLSATRSGDRHAALRAGRLAAAASGSVRDWWWSAAGLAHAQAKLSAGVEPAECLKDMLLAGGGPALPLLDPGNRPPFYEPLVHAELARGDIAAALGWVDRMDSAVADLNGTLSSRSALVQLVRAEVLLAGHQPRQALDHAVRAFDAFTAGNQHFFAARAQLATGRALTATGDRRQGLAHLRRAQAVFTELGADRFTVRAVRSQREAGRRAIRQLPAEHRPDVTVLTRREAEVARLVAKGHTNRQIAQRLSLSERTVETHVHHIRVKLDVPSRTAVAAVVARHDTQRLTY